MDNWIEEGSRKANYWRGFRSACILIAVLEIPLLIALAVYLNHVLAALN